MQRIKFFPAFSLVIIFSLLVGCSTGAPVTLPQGTPVPAKETFTPMPSPTLIPSPTATLGPRAETILSAAGELCNSQQLDAENRSLEETALHVPLMTLINMGSNAEGWQYTPFIPYVEAYTADEVRMLVCVRETYKNVGNYDDGSSAMQRLWFVQLVSWPDGKLLASNHFEGSPPPQSKIADSGPGFGLPPQAETEEWLMPAVQLTDHLLYAGFMPSSLVFSPDGNTLLIAGSRPDNLAWDLTNNSVSVAGKDIIPVSSSNATQSYDLSAPDGSPLVIETFSTSTAVQDGFGVITSGMLMSDFGPALENLRIAISPDRKWLAATPQFDIAGPGKHPAAIVWDVQDGTVIHVIETENPFYFEHISFSPDGRHLLITSIPLSQLWDTGTWQMKQEFPNASAAAFSPDGKFLALGFLQGQVDLFNTGGPVIINMETGEQIVLSGYHESSWIVLVFSPDGKRLASCGHGKFVKLWDIP